MRERRTPGPRRIPLLAERSLWALGLFLLALWGFHQAALRFEQARLEESFFSGRSLTGEAREAEASHPDDAAHASLAAAAPAVRPVLEPGSPIALIEISRVGVRAMVVEGVDHRSLKRAVGHVPGTSVPGMAGNTVLAAHRDTLFAGLRHVELGDLVTMKTEERTYTYRVSSIEVVHPTAVEVMDPTPDEVLTLVTCFPFDFVGPAPMRFIVRASHEASLDEAPEAPAGRASSEPGRVVTTSGARRPHDGARRPLDPKVLSFLSGSLVKPGAN